MRAGVTGALLALLAAPGAAVAEPAAEPTGALDLTVRLPPTLAMRAAQAGEPADDGGNADSAAVVSKAAPARDQFLDFGSRADREPPPSLEEKLIFRFNLGFGIDGGQLDCDADGACTRPPSGISSEGFDRFYYSRLRTYGFGDAVIGSRGLVAQSLNTYFAANFRFDQTGLRSTAVPSVHDAAGVADVLVRHGYAETDGFFRHKWLRPIFVRAGRQFRYGPAIAHFDGLTIGYDAAGVSFALYTGTRVSMYDFDPDLVDRRGLITGIDARVDVNELKGVPLVLNGSMLSFDDEAHFEGGLALRWSADAVVRASGRIQGRAFASQRLSIRTRVSKVTTISAEIENQARSNWPYDLLLSRQVEEYQDPTDPRRYLDFGRQLPQVHLGLRAGTVLLDNIDLLLRIAGVIERNGRIAGADGDSASYLEGGVAFEVRVRRAVGIGASLLARRHSRMAPSMIVDTPQADELPSQIGPIGEASFAEGGVSVRFEPSRKSFGATAELYGRLYDLQSPYIDPADSAEFRSGGRFGVEVWANDRLRMRVEYDTAFAPDFLAPELRGINSLRVLAEGTY